MSDPIINEDEGALLAQIEAITQVLSPCLVGGARWNTFVLPVRRETRFLRVSLPIKQVMHFVGLSVFAEENGDPVKDYTFAASSFHKVAHPGGPESVKDLFGGIHTLLEDNPYVTIDLGTEQFVDTFHLQGRGDAQASRNWTFMVEISSDGENWTTIHDHQLFVGEIEKLVDNMIVAMPDAALRPVLRTYADTLLFWLRGNPVTRKLIEDCCLKHGLSASNGKIVEGHLNTQVMYHFKREITGHGNHESFRFWTEQAIFEYLTESMKVCRDLQEISPYTCVGYGGVLSFVRDGTLIPHDDDIDIVIAFEKSEETPTIAIALAKTEAFLIEKGWKVSGNMLSHRWVNVWRNKNIDVFVGLVEGEHASFFPGPRKQIEVEQMFPPITGKLCGVDLLIPKNPFHYIEKVYGETWRHPQPGFTHVWSGKDFMDIIK